jgi:ABC-type multidrug transport system fused ATPase/permease subunit
MGADAAPGDGIACEGLTFQYGDGSRALEGVSLRVEKGCSAALVGPSGSGKSTIIKLLMGFYPPGEGRIVVDGKALGSYRLEDLRRIISYVPQDPYLFSGTIAENIGFGRPGASRDDIMEAAKSANAHDFITALPMGYDTEVGEKGTSLSGGQRQRIAIARALLKDAPILLLDEATSALDSESERLVQDALDVLMKGRTTIAVAHRLSTIQNAGVIYVIDEGRVVETGKHEDLVKLGGVYSRLYNLQFGLNEEETASA